MNDYAYNKNKELVFIDGCIKGEKYTCPCCGEELKINKKEHVFKHKNKTCDKYWDTVLYLLAKEIIKEKKKLFLPIYSRPELVCILRPEYNDNMVEINGGPYKFNNIYPNPSEIVNGLKADIICEDSKNNFILLVDLNIGEGDISEEKYKLIKEYRFNYLNIIIPRTIETKKELERYLIDEWGVIIDRSNGRKITYLKYYVNYPYGDRACKKLYNHYLKVLKKRYRCSKVKDKDICEYCFKNIYLKQYLTALQSDCRYRTIKWNYKFLLDINSIKDIIIYLRKRNMYYFPVSDNDIEEDGDATPRLLKGINMILNYYYKSKPINGYKWNCNNIMGVANGITMCTGYNRANFDYRIKNGLKIKIPRPPKFEYPLNL